MQSSGSGGYGLLLVEEQDNGNIAVTEIDESNGQPLDTWTVTPAGGAA